MDVESTSSLSFRRKSLSGNWKTNIGQSLLEEIPVSGQHKLWVDEVSSVIGNKSLIFRWAKDTTIPLTF